MYIAYFAAYDHKPCQQTPTTFLTMQVALDAVDDALEVADVLVDAAFTSDVRVDGRLVDIGPCFVGDGVAPGLEQGRTYLCAGGGWVCLAAHGPFLLATLGFAVNPCFVTCFPDGL